MSNYGLCSRYNFKTSTTTAIMWTIEGSALNFINVASHHHRCTVNFNLGMVLVTRRTENVTRSDTSTITQRMHRCTMLHRTLETSEEAMNCSSVWGHYCQTGSSGCARHRLWSKLIVFKRLLCLTFIRTASPDK